MWQLLLSQLYINGQIYTNFFYNSNLPPPSGSKFSMIFSKIPLIDQYFIAVYSHGFTKSHPAARLALPSRPRATRAIH